MDQKKFITEQAKALCMALESKGIKVISEYNDNGYKHVDICLPDVKIFIEVDGLQHLTNFKQIISDFDRDYYSGKEHFDTLHIPNFVIKEHSHEIANAISQVVNIRKEKLIIQRLHVLAEKTYTPTSEV